MKAEGLLEPYIKEIKMNDQASCMPRDSAATMNAIHLLYVSPENYTGDCAWIKQAVEEHSVCLPLARVVNEGPFRMLKTEEAI